MGKGFAHVACILCAVFVLALVFTFPASASNYSYDDILAIVLEEWDAEDAEAVGKLEVSGMSQNTGSTFGDTKTFSGSTEPGAEINISVAELSEDGELSVVENYELSVGRSGLFKQKADLFMGHNIVVIDVNSGENRSVLVYVLKRLPPEVEQELKNNISLPVSIR